MEKYLSNYVLGTYSSPYNIYIYKYINCGLITAHLNTTQNATIENLPILNRQMIMI